MLYDDVDATWKQAGAGAADAGALDSGTIRGRFAFGARGECPAPSADRARTRREKLGHAPSESECRQQRRPSTADASGRLGSQ